MPIIKKTILHKWITPTMPGQRVHADLCYLEGHTFIIIIDSFSKWPEIVQITNYTTQTIVRIFKEYFARWRIIKTLVTDNGPPFNAKDSMIFVCIME